MKTFNTQENIGKAKYVVNYHDGVSTHKDGSPFYGIAIFSNKKLRDKFTRELLMEGYTEDNRGSAEIFDTQGCKRISKV